MIFFFFISYLQIGNPLFIMFIFISIDYLPSLLYRLFIEFVRLGFHQDPGGGGVLDFGLDGGVPPGPRDPNPSLEVKKVPMFRDFAQKIDLCLGIFWKLLWFWRKMDPCLGIWGSKMGPMFRDFFVKNRPIWAARPRIAFLWKYPPRHQDLSVSPHGVTS